jgi:hypothetical protein
VNASSPEAEAQIAAALSQAAGLARDLAMELRSNSDLDADGKLTEAVDKEHDARISKERALAN